MGENSGIAWTHHTFNPWIGCSEVSPACDNCYARAGSARLGAQHGLQLWKGDRYETGERYWRQPEIWNKRAERAGERHRVFCASMADVFDGHVARIGDRKLADKRAALFELIEETPSLDWLLLTKRPENMIAMTCTRWPDRWPDNVWAGTTVENQEWANTRVPLLLRVPARTHFVSCEPQLGPVDFTNIVEHIPGTSLRFGWNALMPPTESDQRGSLHRGRGRIDWIISGGESGPKARPFNIGWAAEIRAQCRATRVAFFMKQLGSNPVKASGSPFRATGKGDDITEWPVMIREQAFPLPLVREVRL